MNAQRIGTMLRERAAPRPARQLTTSQSTRYPVELGDTDTGNLIRIDNALDTLDEHLKKLRNGLHQFKKRQSDIKSELEKDEGYADKIEYYRNKVDELDEKLGAKEK